MIKVCGLWKNKKKADGEIFLAGNLAGLRLVVMKNKFKTKDEHPDWVVFVEQRETKKAGDEPVDNSDME